MIHLVDLRIHSLTQSPDEYNREVKARIASVALSALVPLEAALRWLNAVLKVTAYVVSQPFKLSSKIVKLIKDPSYTKNQFAQEERSALKNAMISVAKAIACTASIILTPLIAPFSPRAMIHMHADMGLVTLPNRVTYQAPQAKPGEKKPLLNSSVKKNIDEKFLSVHTSQKERDKLQKYGLTPPNSILLYGPSNSANKTAAVYIASNLGKNLKELNFTDDKAFNAWLEKFHPDSDIVYINLKKIGIQSYKKITDILDKGKVMYILSAKESDAHATHLKVEVSLPDEAIRGEVLHRNLDKTPKDEQFNFALVTQATDGLKLKKIEKLLQEIKRKAFETSSPIITELALETITSSKKPKISSTAPASVNDFVGMEELHEKFDFYLQVLKNPEEAKEYGVKLPAGMLLYGPPGCGKTYTAKHLCDYAKSKGVHLNFQEIKASDVASKWKGEGIQKIHKVFEEAKRCAPVILFIDECEGLFPSRDKLKDTLSTERTQELDEALQMIEQAKDHNIIIVGATNHISSIDSAILRTGRFDYTFEVKPPNEATRRKMFEAKLKLKKCDPHLDLETVVKNSEGFSASDIETAVNDAGLSSWKQKTPINQAILMKSLETIKSKKASVTHEPGKEPGLPPIMHDLKKGVDALRQFVGNLDSIRPQAAVANDMH